MEISARALLQVIMLDPTQESSSLLLSVAEMFYDNNIPLRLVCAASAPELMLRAAPVGGGVSFVGLLMVPG